MPDTSTDEIAAVLNYIKARQDYHEERGHHFFALQCSGDYRAIKALVKERDELKAAVRDIDVVIQSVLITLNITRGSTLPVTGRRTNALMTKEPNNE